ncbi:cholesterol 25-hydroxylase-like protein [Seriola lalandi dorsalis]|uniref:Fatty acid hydroxylase domain-containing protein n=1 Tax=Seriola lalandi dorsalis TaxID=1841481 RepID=A0A3B4Y5T4_SERLL|nr:cholesterol 25-hydroxylase-like protein [Seriola lalandi dorsalis]XP_056233354.1 cholesterol 25-hydroxylase-like protein [Seriola aureovittata]
MMDTPSMDHGVACAPVLQGLWEHVRNGQEEILLSPYLPALCAFLTHVLFCAPFFVLDALGSVCQQVRSWRIAAGSGSPPSILRWFYCFWRVLFKYLTIVLPATALLQTLRSPSLPALAPSCWQLFVEVCACFLLFDMLFFIWHFSMHRVPWLYRNIHQLHHQHQTPFALASQDASSAELLSLLLLALSSAWVVGCHPLSEVLFHLLNSWMAVEDHCGYNLPWALHRLLPFLGGAPFHQAHHSLYNRNYAPYFTHWDHLFGTYYG